MDTPSSAQRLIWSVSELTSKIKFILEDKFSFIWITGEISDFKIPASGHYYFTLKDEKARISAVMFKGQNRHLEFQPEDGMRVVGLGRVSVYEPRGAYQIILEILEPMGIGALQVAFEQLKRRLHEEGLFDERFKKPLPFFPEKIAVITSPTGAVIHDILHVARRRFENARVIVIPTAVQGDSAESQIISAIELLNTRKQDGKPVADVAILARGGGSLEDLKAFNSEPVARAIFTSEIPIVSAVGHETDFTIADFVADLRAPTPSAAAEIVFPKKFELWFKIREFHMAIVRIIMKSLKNEQNLLQESRRRLKDPRKIISDQRLKLDEDTQRLIRGGERLVETARQRLSWRTENLLLKSPRERLFLIKEKHANMINNILKIFKINFINKMGLYQTLSSRLQALSPMEVLGRGYSITFKIPEGSVVMNPDQVDIHENVDVLMAKGKLRCRVEGKSRNGQTDI